MKTRSQCAHQGAILIIRPITFEKERKKVTAALICEDPNHTMAFSMVITTDRPAVLEITLFQTNREGKL